VNEETLAQWGKVAPKEEEEDINTKLSNYMF
jgi:hypothetical protein